MSKVYSVDAALEKNRPHIELRGKVYELRDLTMRQRVEKIMEFKERQESIEEEIEEEEDREAEFEDVQDVIANAVMEVLVGVPEEVAKSITEMEWKALQEAIKQARQAQFPVEIEDRDDVKKVESGTA